LCTNFGPFRKTGSFARYELLNCGYNISVAIETIDTLMSGYISELSIALDVLSKSLKTEEELLAKSFDERHVQSALELLMSAGLSAQKLVSFQLRTRERLRHLSSGIRVSSSQDPEGTVDSLSVVEVAALLAREVCGQPDDKRQSQVTILQLQNYSNIPVALSGSNPVRTLYPESFVALDKLSGAGRSFVFDILFSVPRLWLRSVTSMPVWRGGNDVGKEMSSFAPLDNYNKLPQQYITQIGEHILALVHALEPFASNSEALVTVNQVLPGLKSLARQAWKDLISTTGCGIDVEDDSKINLIVDGTEEFLMIPTLLSGSTEHSFYEEESEKGTTEQKEAADFCNQWLDVVCSAVTGRLLEKILRISRLSPTGCAQMEADLTYIINVFSAIGLQGHPHPLLVHLLELIRMSHISLASRIKGSNGKNSSEIFVDPEIFLKSVEDRVATMRSIGIS